MTPGSKRTRLHTENIFKRAAEANELENRPAILTHLTGFEAHWVLRINLKLKRPFLSQKALKCHKPVPDEICSKTITSSIDRNEYNSNFEYMKMQGKASQPSENKSHFINRT